MKRILFLCTGNYYRSRFAEILFNHLSDQHQLSWIADSRGYKADNPNNIGPLSKFTIDLVKKKNLHYCEDRFPLRCTETDIQHADRVIALKKTEHLPMTLQLFPAFADKVEYWEIHDIDYEKPDTALLKLEQKVNELIEELKSGNTAD